MKLTAIQELKDQLAASTNRAKKEKQEHDEVIRELEAVKLAVEGMIAKQLDTDEDLTDEIARAEARVSVAAAKVQRVQQKQEQLPPASSVNLQSAKYAIEIQASSYVSKGIEAEMAERLVQLQQAKDAYLDAVEDTLVEFLTRQKEFRQELREAESLLGTPIREPYGLGISILRPHGLWMNGDAQEALHKLINIAEERVNGAHQLPLPKIQDRQVIPPLKPTTHPKEEVREDGTVVFHQSQIHSAPKSPNISQDSLNNIQRSAAASSPGSSSALVSEALGRMGVK